jgi:hypothetical protein
LSLIAALVMVLGLCPAIALANDVEVEVEPTGGEEPTLATQGDPVLTPQDGSPYGLCVGNVVVTNEKLSDTGWSYDPENNILTLNGYSFDGTQSPTNARGIYYEGNEALTIELKGTNTVKGIDAGIESAGIESNQAGIVISGTGTLTAEGGEFGIYSWGSLTITNSTVKAYATDKTSGDNGICARESLTINSGDVTAESTANTEGVGVWAGGDVEVGKDVTSFIASGNSFAIDEDILVKNAVAGLGWMDAAGTGPKAAIRVSEDGQTLEYLRVQFPAPTYAVTVKADPAEGGTAKASAERAAEMETITLTAKSNDGYEFAGWTVVGEGAQIYDAGKPEAKLTVGAADVTATATFRKAGPSAAPTVTAHVQRVGWMSAVTDGGLAGTTGKSRRLEALTLKLPDGVSGSIEYCGHVQRSGWEKSYAADGKVAGTEGMSRRLEAVQIRLSGAAKDNYDVYYRVHVQRLGWMGWAKNDEPAGTQGMSRRAEAVQVALVPKGAPAPLATYKGVTQDNAKSFIKK